MSQSDETPDCWNRIGVWGTESPRCEHLAEVVHCRNCEVFVAAGRQIFERPLPAGYLEEQRRQLAGEETSEAAGSGESVIAFRLGVEWFALPTAVFEAITEARPVHRLPHVAAGYVQGVVNIGGEVRLCHALASLLEAGEAAPAEDGKQIYRRLLVVRLGGEGYVFPADEVLGLLRYRREQLRPPPATIAEVTRRRLRGSLEAAGRTLVVLDEAAIHQALSQGHLGAPADDREGDA